MAWTEQCKVAMQTNANAKLLKYKNRNRKVNIVLRELSKESDIPFATLKNWYYEKENSISSEISTDSAGEISTEPEPTPICVRCGNSPVFLTNRGKPLMEESKYHGLCNGCRTNQTRIEQIDRQATESKTGLMTVCPHCSKTHYMNPGTRYDRNKGE